MLVRILHIGGGIVDFNENNEGSSAGWLLQEGQFYTSKLKDATLQLQELTLSDFTICYRIFEVLATQSFQFQELRQGLRLEAVLSGEVVFLEDASQLFSGQYHFSNASEFSCLFKGHTATSIFVTYFSDDFFKNAGIVDLIKKKEVYQLNAQMTGLIQQIFKHDYTQQLRNFFYENCIRELILLHLKQGKHALPESLDEKILDIILRADKIIMANLNIHYTIHELAKMCGTNAFTLKHGFRLHFKMGIFERLSLKRLSLAKEQLQHTRLSIEEISTAAGFQHVASFIRAFKKRFGTTPLEWRKGNRIL